MTHPSTEQMFRHAAETEDGMTVSAGARVAHIRLALESGRAITIDLAHVPEDLRSSLIAEIRDRVRLAAEKASRPDANSLSDSAAPLRPS